MKQFLCKDCRMLAQVVLVLFLGTLSAAQSSDGATRSRMAMTRASQPTTRRVFVHSTSLLVRAAVVEDKLLKTSEFKQMGFLITRDPLEADLVLELRHDLLTKYVFTVIDAKTMTVIAGGKLSSLGGTVAGKVAKRFVKEMKSTS